MNLGDFNSSVASPIMGADLTAGFTPSTMHNDPYTGLPIGQAPVVVIAPQAPTLSGVPWMLLLVLAGVAWYGYKQGWFAGLFEGEPESITVIERRAA